MRAMAAILFTQAGWEEMIAAVKDLREKVEKFVGESSVAAQDVDDARGRLRRRSIR